MGQIINKHSNYKLNSPTSFPGMPGVPGGPLGPGGPYVKKIIMCIKTKICSTKQRIFDKNRET